jgi:hypothetical protein
VLLHRLGETAHARKEAHGGCSNTRKLRSAQQQQDNSMVGRPFQKGKSGNRPKLDPELRSACKKHTREAVDTLLRWLRSENPRASVVAAKEILDRGWGKPTQHTEHSGVVTLEQILDNMK